MFDEAPVKEIKNMYTVTAMAWRSGNDNILLMRHFSNSIM
jgi:hypothetical protein